MFSGVLLWAAFSFTAVFGGIPKIPPTKGRPWPLPQNERQGEDSMQIDPKLFKFRATGNNCPILQRAFKRYYLLSFPDYYLQKNIPYKNCKNLLKSLDVYVATKCDNASPELHMDELYELKICSPTEPTKATLVSQTIWGALRGLETFSQILVSNKDGFYNVNCTQILDYPRYTHRGVMLDTSRHYLPVDVIYANLELMAMNKMNVFHWHIVDGPSFPYVSKVYPDLSANGAWSNKHLYTEKDIQGVVDYAVELGIRVMAEFDTPGHTKSWGLGQPGLLTPCYTNGTLDGTFGPIDPTKEENFEFIENLFQEVTKRFPEKYLHLGGDEVPFECWDSNADIKDFMRRRQMLTYPDLEEYYISRVINITANLPNKNGYVVWQEVFDNGVKLNQDTIVHIWKGQEHWKKEMEEVTEADFKVILSSCWYLNYISYGVDWPKYYECDPGNFNGTEEQKRLVLGGEACMWGEYVDRTNVISRTWPRASVVAERLWSNPKSTEDPDEAAPRLEEHRCRLLNRGYDAEPLGPSFCEIIR